MKRHLIIILSVLLPLTMMAAKASKVSVAGLSVENLRQNTLGLDTKTPRFSWKINDYNQEKGVRQTAYQIIVASSEEKMKAGEGDLWNTGWVESDEQLWIPYGGKPLTSNQHCWWNVRVKTNKGETGWSANIHHFSIGLLGESHWQGRWIGLERLMPGEEAGVLHSRLAARYLRKEFKLKDKKVRRATAYIAGMGLYRLYINGKPVQGVDEMTPVPSDFRKTIYYNTYDVTRFIDTQTAVGIVLGNGRFFAMRQVKPYKNTTFGLPKCRLNIIVEYEDGTSQRLVTDEKWRVTTDGPIRANNEYDGEEYDARLQLGPWTMPGYDDTRWMQAERSAIPTGTLRGQMTPNMCVQRYHKPRHINRHIIDFGVNMAGRVSFIPKGKAGDTIRIRYAEKLNPDGTLYVENLRDARSEDVYVCSGKEPTTTEWKPDVAWQATFVTHGFRYVEVSGMNDLDTRSIVAEEIYDGIAGPNTNFICSDTILNKVYQNACQGIASNYKGMPVDCPQRNERQPWLGDRTAGSLGESFVFQNERLYTKWMRDICESQREDGVFSDVAPAYWNYYNDDVTWPAALPFTCDMLYQQFGNDEAIRRSYPYIKRWLEHLFDEYLKDGIITKDTYGDWCVPPEKLELIHSQDPARKTDGSLISTAYVIHILKLMEQFALLQQMPDDAGYYAKKREVMIADFNKKFLTVKRGTSPRAGHVLYPDSVFYGNNTATANLLPLAFGIVPDDCREDVVKQVVENICVKNKGHVSCGVIGISWLMRVLSDNGFADVAYLLATQKKYPSWGYMAEQGATTIWELWNGDKASPKMNSGNHVMLLGDLITWCYQFLGGIRPAATDATGSSVGYKHFMLKPAFDIEDCEQVSCKYDTPYGAIHSEWKKTLQHLDWHILVPCNTTAEVHFPDGSIKTVGSGSYDFSVDIPTADKAIVKDEFLYEHTFFPEAHASTIVELKNGDLVAGYFGGTHERDPDVCIWVNIKKKGSNEWSKPILAADGVLSLDDPNAKLMGLSGLKDDTTPATAGPIIQRFCGLGSANSHSAALADELNYDYNTKTTRLTNVPAKLKRKACWNPVLFEMPDGELWLFFKIGTTVGDWTGWLAKSKDGGRTWSDKEPLGYATIPDGSPSGKQVALLGPIKNKPEIINGRLLCPSSTENNGWRFHMELLDLKTNAWKYVPVESTEAIKTDDNKLHPIDCIQPSILKLKDGRLQVTMRTHNAKIATSYSSDNGDSWAPVTLLDIENNQSGTDAVTLKDGRHALIYNNFETLPLTKKGVRTPVSIALSDDGQTWRHALTLEDSPIDQYSYPAIIQGKNGHLYCVYTWRRQRVAFKEIDIKKLK